MSGLSWTLNEAMWRCVMRLAVLVLLGSMGVHELLLEKGYSTPVDVTRSMLTEWCGC